MIRIWVGHACALLVKQLHLGSLAYHQASCINAEGVVFLFRRQLLKTSTPHRSGLEGRLLGLALQAEQPQLEAQRTALLQQEEEQRLQLAALDTQVLQSLATSKVTAFTSVCSRCCHPSCLLKHTCRRHPLAAFCPLPASFVGMQTGLPP